MTCKKIKETGLIQISSKWFRSIVALQWIFMKTEIRVVKQSCENNLCHISRYLFFFFLCATLSLSFFLSDPPSSSFSLPFSLSISLSHTHTYMHTNNYIYTNIYTHRFDFLTKKETSFISLFLFLVIFPFTRHVQHCVLIVSDTRIEEFMHVSLCMFENVCEWMFVFDIYKYECIHPFTIDAFAWVWEKII